MSAQNSDLPFLVVGNGEHARAISDLLHGKSVSYFDVPDALIPNRDYSGAVIAIGDNSKRQRIAMDNPEISWTTLISETSFVSRSAVLGPGTQVLYQASIEAGAKIGKHCIINSGAVVTHDCVIGDYVHIAPGARLGGAAKVGEGTLIGIGAILLPGVHVGKWCRIGAGSVVNRDIADNAVAYGVPARVR
jgi:sugar O-acyltransferase (sialic acid O-acetyltransferase NeuD family)